MRLGGRVDRACSAVASSSGLYVTGGSTARGDPAEGLVRFSHWRLARYPGLSPSCSFAVLLFPFLSSVSLLKRTPAAGRFRRLSLFLPPRSIRSCSVARGC